MKDFIILSIYTGLRISDVATFNTTERLKGNDMFLRMHKTKKELYTWIADSGLDGNAASGARKTPWNLNIPHRGILGHADDRVRARSCSKYG